MHLPATVMDTSIDFMENLKDAAIAFGDEPLLVAPDGQVINLAKGYIPLHVNFTVEDKAAKGLRKRNANDTIEPSVYFSAIDLVCEHQFILLTGPSGSGKTTFAKWLAFNLVTATGTAPLANTIPYYYAVTGPEIFRTLRESSIPEMVQRFQATNSNLLIILDNVENLDNEGTLLLTEILAFIKPLKIKLLILGDPGKVKQWSLPSDIIRHDLRPLSEVQRRQAMSHLTGVTPSEVTIGVSAAAATPIYFALAMEARCCGSDVEELVDAWLAVVTPDKEASNSVTALAFALHGRNSISGVPFLQPKSPRLFSSKAVQWLLAARHLINLPLETSIELFHRDSLDFEPIIRSLLARLDNSGRSLLLRGLLSGSRTQTQIAALLISDFVSEPSKLQKEISYHILAIILESTLSIVQREKAGRVISRFGDPRDLTGLTTVPAGDFVLGSEDHPNSQPPSIVSLESFRIGLYPVVNQDYSIFVRDTGRDWQSPDGFDPETQNAPATDLSWHDAMAYCEWLTLRWRSNGKISHDEQVRLPSEPEWERAARGDQRSTIDGETIYPWGTEWKHDAGNYEESGFNSRLPVGLFPSGRSPYGCYDMVGQVWEWCTTQWGEDMTSPSFRYPWHDDEREYLQSSPSIRRVLRGGCFSSGRLKISCTYRGSLEPAGFWRGNGFRIVVAPIRS